VIKPTADDWLTLAALGLLAFALTDVAHEAFGHGGVTWLIGGKAVLLTTCNFDSTRRYSLWIPAGGGLMNLTVGLASLALPRFFARPRPLTRYFLVLAAAFNLFFAFGYPAYSGIARFGDWAAVIAGREPQWLWRTLLVVVSVAGYYGSMRLLAAPLAPFAVNANASPGSRPDRALPDKARLNRLALIPYIAAMLMATAAGALNPNGWRTALIAGLPAAAAAFGLTQMDHFAGPIAQQDPQAAIAPMQRS
jgi:hypothetical protein